MGYPRREGARVHRRRGLSPRLNLQAARSEVAALSDAGRATFAFHAGGVGHSCGAASPRASLFASVVWPSAPAVGRRIGRSGALRAAATEGRDRQEKAAEREGARSAVQHGFGLTRSAELRCGGVEGWTRSPSVRVDSLCHVPQGSLPAARSCFSWRENGTCHLVRAPGACSSQPSACGVADRPFVPLRRNAFKRREQVNVPRVTPGRLRALRAAGLRLVRRPGLRTLGYRERLRPRGSCVRVSRRRRS